MKTLLAVFLGAILLIVSACSSDSQTGPRTYHVSEFGALPDDGVTDNVAIQAAVNAAGLTGGVVVLSTGVYDLWKLPLTLSSVRIEGLKGVTIRGAGAGTTHVTLDIAPDSPLVSIRGAVEINK